MAKQKAPGTLEAMRIVHRICQWADVREPTPGKPYRQSEMLYALLLAVEYGVLRFNEPPKRYGRKPGTLNDPATLSKHPSSVRSRRSRSKKKPTGG